jgi:hypothetical protein
VAPATARRLPHPDGNPTRVQRETAAALYSGPGSVITGAAALRYHRLPAPESDTVDASCPPSSADTFLGCAGAWWPEAGLAAEVDSRRWHLSPEDWEKTMDRHGRFGQHGIVTLHFTPHRIRTSPDAVIAKPKDA